MIAKKDNKYFIALFSFLLLLGFVFSPIVVTFGQESEIWMKSYGGPNDDDCFSALLALDGGYILAGDTASLGVGETDVWLIKTDSNGEMEWNKTYGGAFDDDVQFMITDDDGYIIVGRTYSFGKGDADLWLIKTDISGNMIWNQTYGGAGAEWAWSIVKTSDDGYALLGLTNSFGEGDNDFWLIKTDSEGLLEWHKDIGDAGDDRGRFLVNTDDGGFLLLGWTNSLGAGAVDYWLVKTDFDGNHQWNKTYGGENGDRGKVIVETETNGYLLGGSTGSFGAGNTDMWLVRIDSTGNHIWNKTYGGPDRETVNSLLMTDDGGFAFVGYTYSFGAGDQDGWLLRIDSTGNLLWNQTYGGIAHESIHSLQQMEQSGYLLSGFSASQGEGDTDVLLIKTDSTGIIPEFSTFQVLLVIVTLTLLIIIHKTKLSI